MRRLIYALPVVMLILCASPVFANPSPLPLRSQDSMSALPQILLLDLAADAFFILLSLLILGQAGKARLGTIVKVISIAMVAGFAADEIGIGVLSLLTRPFRAGLGEVAAALIVSILFIASANFLLARHYFKLTDNKALTLSFIVGVFTMPVGFLFMAESAKFSIYYSRHLHYSYDPNNLHAYAIIGTVLAVASIILLILLKPVTSLSKVKMGAIGLAVTAGISSFVLIPDIKQNNESRTYMKCIGQMMRLTGAINDYKDLHNDYPPDISAIPVNILQRLNHEPKNQQNNLKYLHCPLDKDKSGLTSYEYRKPPEDIHNTDKWGYDYWMLKCTHHRKVEYIGLNGMPVRGPQDGD
ncbi:MAG: hypothetical protein ACYC27_13885 [Armatimonadota bacterium]